MRLDRHPGDLRLEDCARAGFNQSGHFSDVHDHVAICPACHVRLAEMTEFVAFMRAFPEETTGELIVRREARLGTVFLIVHGSDAAGWEARGMGAGHETVRRFERGPDGYSWLENWFETTFGNPIPAVEPGGLASFSVGVEDEVISIHAVPA